MHLENKPADLHGEETSSYEMTTSREKLPEPVYYVESPEDNTVLVAMNVTLENDASIGNVYIISWFDASRERIMIASKIYRREGGIFSFDRHPEDNSGSYTFTPMNLEIYKNKVQEQLVSGSNFTNEEELIKAFLSTR